MHGAKLRTVKGYDEVAGANSRESYSSSVCDLNDYIALRDDSEN